MATTSDISDFFADRSVLVTGGTGFLGKVLVEKLLRSLPRLQNIYLLIRSRKGVDGKQRWRSLADSCELFESIRNVKVTKLNADGSQSIDSINLLDKVIALNGDIAERDLGLSIDDSKLICDNVSVVFHCAATVRFDERLRLAVQMNVEGTQRLLRLCDRMKRLDVFVHTSTAYANCDRSHVAETIYPSPVPWKRLVDGLEWLNDEMFHQLTPLLIGGRPNTYTFTKAVAESMIADDEQASKHFPIIIVRPSIVTAIWRDPIPGWIDNVNGATSMIAMGAKGLLRSMCGDLDHVRADVVPVDVVANALIVAAWHRATVKDGPMPVIHCTTGVLNPVYWGRVVNTTMDYFTNQMPLADLFRIPGGRVTTNPLEHRLRLLFDHLVPAYALDLVCKASGQKAIMVRTYDKISKVLTILEYFYTHSWDFDSVGIVSLNNSLSDNDRKAFYIDVKGIDWQTYFVDYCAGVRKFIFKELPSTVTTARKVHFRRRLISILVLIGVCLLLVFFIFRYLM